MYCSYNISSCFCNPVFLLVIPPIYFSLPFFRPLLYLLSKHTHYSPSRTVTHSMSLLKTHNRHCCLTVPISLRLTLQNHLNRYACLLAYFCYYTEGLVEVTVREIQEMLLSNCLLQINEYSVPCYMNILNFFRERIKCSLSRPTSKSVK